MEIKVTLISRKEIHFAFKPEISMAWLWAVIAVLSAILCVASVGFVHFRAYDALLRIEKLEDRTNSLRSKLYNELGKSREEITSLVAEYLESHDLSRATSPDLGQMLLLQMMQSGQMTGQQPGADRAADRDPIHDILLGNGGASEAESDSEHPPSDP